ncbi:MAG: NAD-dependent epimerase/dehydratase family protein, partial [Verrucomicrobiaceae bacterium]|nr:NAD-dependent epimerase/dehydratase family protein [Verrucomicrobiaceae bacterium]
MNTRRLILAGGSGFLGQALAKFFNVKGWDVVVLTRHPDTSSADAREAIWDGETLGSWTDELEGAAAVVNLA